MARSGRQLSAGAVVQPVGQLRLGFDQLVEIVLRPAGSLAAQSGELLAIASAQTRNRGGRGLALELNDDGAVLKRVGHGADGGDCLRRPGREPARLVLAVDADDVGGGLGVAGVEDAAQLLVVLHEAVGLVDEKRRPHLFDVTEQGGRRDVARQLGARRQEVQQR